MFVGSFAMLGGALRGFNLLLVLAGLLVGALIMQWRWSRHSIDAVRVQRRLPNEAFAGASFRVRYRLTNHSRWLPVWMVRVEDRIESAEPSERALAVCGVGSISPQRTVIAQYDCLVARRGLYRFGPIGLMTTFPFSLFSSRLLVDGRSQLHVYPQLLTLRPRWQQRLVKRSDGMANSARRSGPMEGDFFGLREWQSGDSPKWIHWRTTARLSEPAVRQFEQQRRFDSLILVDAHVGPEPVVEQARQQVELAISLAATILVQLAVAPSNRIVLAVAGRGAEAVIGGGSSQGKRRMLEVLASLQPADQPPLVAAVSQAIDIVGQSQDLIVISPRGWEQVKQAQPALLPAIARWVRRGTFRWLNVGDQTIQQWIVRDAPAGAKLARDDRRKAATAELTEVR
jgi:uncharacterized protein (DUF58 family)